MVGINRLFWNGNVIVEVQGLVNWFTQGMKRGATILFLSFLLILGACSTPQKLIDRAIKRDPSIVNTFSDTITIKQTVLDSFLVVRNDTSFFEKIVRVIERDTIINLSSIEVERKKTRQEIRKNARLERLKEKLDAKISKLKLKNDKLQAKLDAKTKQKADKEKQKTERTTVKQENKNRFWLGYLLGVLTLLILKLVLWKLNWTTSGILAKLKN